MKESYDDLEEALEEALDEGQVEQMENEIAVLKKVAAELRSQVVGLQRTLQYRDKEIVELEEQVTQLQQTLRYRNREIDELTAGIAGAALQHEAELAMAAEREQRLRDEVTHLRSLAMVMANPRFEEQQ